MSLVVWLVQIEYGHMRNLDDKDDNENDHEEKDDEDNFDNVSGIWTISNWMT